MKGAKHKKLEALAIWMGLLNAENRTATDDIYILIYSNIFLFCN
jgi:hypothetical protein